MFKLLLCLFLLLVSGCDSMSDTSFIAAEYPRAHLICLTPRGQAIYFRPLGQVDISINDGYVNLSTYIINERNKKIEFIRLVGPLNCAVRRTK